MKCPACGGLFEVPTVTIVEAKKPASLRRGSSVAGFGSEPPDNGRRRCGIELAARFQERCPGIQTLLCTGMPEDAGAVCDARGIRRVSVIARSVETPNLVEKVRELCPKQAARS